MITSASTFAIDGHHLPVNTHDGKYYCFESINSAIYWQLKAMISYHNKVLSLRIDLHMGGYSESNMAISRIMEKIRKHLASYYGCTRFGYIWVREQEKAKQQHYHLILFMDANKIQHPSRLIAWIEKRWMAQGHPKPYTPKNCYFRLARDDSKAFSKVFYRASYLAKVRGKGYTRPSVNRYGTSRLRVKEI